MGRRAMQRRGQSTVELAALMVCAVLAIVALAIYYQRAVQGSVKSSADSVGSQFSSTAPWNLNTNSTSTSRETRDTVTTTQSQDSNYSQNF